MDNDIKTYLDANFMAIRAETKAMADLNAEQHKHIIELLDNMKKRTEVCEENHLLNKDEIVKLQRFNSKLKGIWVAVVLFASWMGSLLISYIKTHLK